MTGPAAALTALDAWPVGVAAAAVVGPGGVLAAHGPQDHSFALASVTKPLTALATLVAVEEGALALDDPADEDLLPGATVADLLAHCSGLAPDAPTRAAAPRTRRVYSNAGFDRIGRLVEQAVGMPFGQYLHEALAEPLGLGIRLDGSPARDGVASVADLCRVAVQLLAPGPALLHPSTLAQATSVHAPGLRGVLPGFGLQDPNDWGLGLEVRGHKSPHWTGAANSPATVGHFGQSGTMLWVDPVAGVALVALSDRAFGPWAAAAWPSLSDAVLTALR